jgi:predicted GIY-YIG superfamily endonuclease
LRHETILRLYFGKQEERTLYIGVANNLLTRVYEHKNCLVGGFTQKYHVELA